MRILVTGGAGFLGFHLCRRLIDLGHEVVCLDNFSTGCIENCIEHPNYHLIHQDLCDFEDIDVDAIYNLACPASPIHYQADPIQTIKTNTLGMIKLLDFAKKRQIPVLQASTSEVYGDPQVHPQKENYWGHVNPNGPRACYDEGKRIAETLCLEYHKSHGVPIRIARIFNTYGPRMHPEDGRVVSNFIVQALNGQSITVYGDGAQTRSFCYVEDLIRGLVMLMESDVNEPVNLGNPEEFTVLELANQIIALTGADVKVCFEPLPVDDPKQRKPDISRAQQLLGWHPSTALGDGLSSTIEYFIGVVQQARAIS